MRKNFVVLTVILVAIVGMTACNQEIKPSKPGVFVVADGKLSDWTPISMDEEATAEGFFLPFFKGEVTTILRYPTSYIILNLDGEYRPMGIRSFVLRNGRFEEDSSAGLVTDAIQSQQFKGEKQMYKVKLTRDLKPGVYVLDFKPSQGRQVHYAFKIP
jgi:hypothetical protein